MSRLALVVMLAACSDPAAVLDAGVDATADAARVDEIVVSPVGFDFGDFDVGSIGGATRFTFEVSNAGVIDASLTSIAIQGQAASDFTIEANDCGPILPAKQSCNVRVAFVATVAGERDAMLQITGSTSATAVLSGKGLAPPSRIRFTPGSRNFGDLAVGSTGAPFTFTVTNDIAPTTLTASLRGPGAAAFRIVSTDCTGIVLPLGGMCTVTVAMAPPFGGQFIAEVVLTEPNGSMARGGLNGLSTAPLTMGPYTGLFGSFLIGQPAAGKQITFTVTNTGTVTTGPLAATVVGAAATDFTVRSTTCTTLVPSASCSVVVELTPATRGAKLAELSVTDTVTEVRTTLRGNAYSLLVTGGAFPNTVSGQSAMQTFKVSNASDVATGGFTPTLGGNDASQFAIFSTTCAAGIPAHNGCLIVVHFNPTSAGIKTATLDVSATPGGSDSFTMTGRGI